jgi:hypothetical protein
MKAPRVPAQADPEPDRQAPPAPTRPHAILALQRSAGNHAVSQLLRKDAVKDVAEKVGIDAGGDEQIDEVDSFLESRRSLYKVTLVGTNVHITLPRSHEWTARYTNRALTEGALGAAINTIFMGGASAAEARKAYEKVVGTSVKFTPASKQMHGKDAFHFTIIDDEAVAKIGEALNRPPRYVDEKWREKLGEAKLIEFALDLAYDAFDKLAPLFDQKQLKASKLTVPLIRYLLEKKTQTMIEVAKRHPAAARWRAAYKRNLALYWAEREPILEDLDVVPLSEWAKTILELADASRDAVVEKIEHAREESRKHHRNEHLRPHEIKVEDAARFILETYEPTGKARLDPNPWVIHGGMELTNIKGEAIFLLRVESTRVVYQHLASKRFYEQSLEGFQEEQLYSIYAEAGRKAQGVIPIGKWVLGMLGAVFPIVRVGLLAADVLNAANKLHNSQADLQRDYDALRLAYANVDKLVPGVLPKVWDAVLDPKTAKLLNPLEDPDVGAWLKAIVRIVMLRQARIVSGSYAADAVHGFLEKAWAAIKKGMGVVAEVVKHIAAVAPAVAGSTGASGDRVLKHAEKRLKDIGMMQALAVAAQLRNLPEADQRRLVREIEALVAAGTRLNDTVREALSW